jgi:hypothetical protein
MVRHFFFIRDTAHKFTGKKDLGTYNQIFKDMIHTLYYCLCSFEDPFTFLSDLDSGAQLITAPAGSGPYLNIFANY